MSAPVTLDTCAQEPIHIPGSIQPHGIMFACRNERVVAVSENVAQLGVAASAVVGTPIAQHFAPESAAALLTAFTQPDRLPEINPLQVMSASGTPFDAVLHVSSSGEHIIEIERRPTAELRPLGFDPRLRAATIRLQRATSLPELYRLAAIEVRAATGFDRVMVYRFDHEWNGEVVAEAKREDLEPFFGLHYPASDIPEQARRLYTINWLRFIPDIAYQPVPVVPAQPAPLDMSFSILRSVSPIHVEYLRNMGVGASMSVSLIIDGVLVGLIACHHYSGPHLIPYQTRDMCDYLGRSLSWNIGVLERARRDERLRASAVRETSLVRAINETNDFLDGLASPALLQLAEADGVVVRMSDGARHIGSCPPEDVVTRLVEWLQSRQHDVFATSNATVDVPVALEQHPGVLAVAMSRELGEYVIWFRVSSDQTVDWAGDPRKIVVHQPAGAPPRLSPRGSFALWRETIKGKSQRWDDITIDAASNLRRTILSGVRVRATELRAYNDRLLDADRAKDDFIATVSHELRTPLNAILGWAQLLASAPPSPERVRQGLEVIDRNARAQTRIVEDLLDISRMTSGKLSLELETVDFHEIVTDSLDTIAVAAASKSLTIKPVLDGSALVLGDPSRLRQVVVNLLTNAVKFTPKGGSITVSLRKLNSDIELVVRDTGQGISAEFLPLVFDVFRQSDSGQNRRSAGLGLGLAIARKLVDLHGGRISAESDGVGTGAIFRIRLPLTTVRLDSTPPEGFAALSKPLSGFDVLVVEDEDDSRELLCVLLSEAGARCTSLANAAEALVATMQRRYTVIVSDVGMPGQDGHALIRAMRSRPPEQNGDVPAIALTAYTRGTDRTAALDAGFDAHLGKPVSSAELVSVVRSVVARAQRR
ncbi:MAG TPA: ATP-binding protein [Kofleriaceae bacterium]